MARVPGVSVLWSMCSSDIEATLKSDECLIVSFQSCQRGSRIGKDSVEVQ
jgi:hypothetical protein